jgi:hypothetical protein
LMVDVVDEVGRAEGVEFGAVGDAAFDVECHSGRSSHFDIFRIRPARDSGSAQEIRGQSSHYNTTLLEIGVSPRIPTFYLVFFLGLGDFW